MPKKTIWSRYAYLWITLFLFGFSFLGHWIFGWYAFVDEQQAHGEPVEAGTYTIMMLRDTLENWQSEFLQLMWQVAGLAFLFYVGSPQSKESDDRKEEKIDRILRAVAQDADEQIRELDKKYMRT